MRASERKTRFKIVSETGDGIGFGIRLAQLGYDVTAWIRSSSAKSVGDRLLPKAGDLEDMVHDADPERDVFLFDVSGNGIIADALRGRGLAVLGGSVLMDRLERDRDYGYEVMKQCEIRVPDTESFTSFAEAIDFVGDNRGTRWVYKPSKQLGDLSPSHVSYDSEDMIRLLENIEREVEIADPQFELQAFEKGIAMSTELWFQDGQLVPMLTNHTLERKELMNDDLGPSGGCVGNVVWLCDGCAVCDVAAGLVSWAAQHRYHGMLDLNVIAAGDDIYGLEFTPRFGYDAAPTFLFESIKTELGEFLSAVARGRLSDLSLHESSVAAGLRITIPPWPSEKHHADENIPIRGLGKKWQESTYLYNVKADEDGELVTAGAWGILMLLTSRGASVGRALSEPLRRAKELRVKNKQFRTDLVTRFYEDLEKLHSVEVTV